MSYSAEIVQELPDLPQVEFASPGGFGEVVLLVLVRPGTGSPWIGLFRTLSLSDVTSMEAWPHAAMLLVIAGGYPHFFTPNHPDHRIELPILPVRHLLRHESGMVVLGDFVRLCGVDGNGLRWSTPRLGSDWLDDVHLVGDGIEGRGSVSETGGWADFRVHVFDGATETTFQSGT